MFVDFLSNENLQQPAIERNPDNLTKNEINYILSNNGKCCKNVSVLNRVDTGRDYRIDTKIERNKLIKQPRFTTREELEARQEEFQKEPARHLPSSEENNMESTH